MVKLEEYRDIYVFLEQRNQTILNVGFELLQEARKLVASIPHMKYKVVAILFGENIKEQANEAIAYGADQVIVVEHPLLLEYSTQFYSEALSQVIQHFHPDSLLMGATVLGRDLAPRVAAHQNCGLTADATSIAVDLSRSEEALLLVTRPTFGGNLFGTIVCPNTRPQMATIRPNVFELGEKDTSRTGEIIDFQVSFQDTNPQVVVKERIEKVKNEIDICKCEVLIGVGRGAENCISLIEEVAQELNGHICASRAVIEDGYLNKELQVGQTGKTVRPSLYIACGISGACQHTAGMDQSDFIIAINRDPQAEIFKIANLGFVGNVEEILPLVKEQIQTLKK